MKTLTPEQKQFFDDTGYLVVPGMYSENEMVEMRAEFHELITQT